MLRPEPGAAATLARAHDAGFHPVGAPLFRMVPLAWTPPPSDRYDALMLTSANAVRWAGEGLRSCHRLPAYAVGTATADSARSHGFSTVRSGDADAAALLELMVKDGVARPLHLCGRDHRPVDHAQLTITHLPVYAAEAVTDLPDTAWKALNEGAIALVHSPRAAEVLAAVLARAGIERATVRLAAISPAAAAAAGEGWEEVAIADQPTDGALLAAAARLCEEGDPAPSGATQTP